MMEADRVALCGAKSVPDADRRAVRGGTHAQRRGAGRPAHRHQAAAGTQRRCGELELPTFAWAAGTDPLDAATMAAIAAGVSMRRYASTLEELPPPEKALSVSKSAASRRFVALSEEQLHAVAVALAGEAGPAGGDDRRHPLPRPRHPGGPGHRCPGQQARAGAARRLHREHARRALAAERSGRARARCRPRAAVGDRRRQGAAPGHRRVLRRQRARPALPGAQASQRDRAPARGTARQRRAARCATPGTAPTPSWPRSSCSAWRRRCKPSIPAPRPACARGWRRR